jgi:hypothetical protein
MLRCSAGQGGPTCATGVRQPPTSILRANGRVTHSDNRLRGAPRMGAGSRPTQTVLDPAGAHAEGLVSVPAQPGASQSTHSIDCGLRGLVVGRSRLPRSAGPIPARRGVGSAGDPSRALKRLPAATDGALVGKSCIRTGTQPRQRINYRSVARTNPAPAGSPGGQSPFTPAWTAPGWLRVLCVRRPSRRGEVMTRAPSLLGQLSVSPATAGRERPQARNGPGARPREV